MYSDKEQNLISRLLEGIKTQDLLLIWRVLHQGLRSSQLKEIHLLSSKSQIVVENNYLVYCSCYLNYKGLFTKGKSHEGTTFFGRIICDYIKGICNNKGFFTSDELPAYGISRKELLYILQNSRANNNDLVICFAYDEIQANLAKEQLDRILSIVSIELGSILQ